jgi:hypothetical protein
MKSCNETLECKIHCKRGAAEFTDAGETNPTPDPISVSNSAFQKALAGSCSISS